MSGQQQQRIRLTCSQAELHPHPVVLRHQRTRGQQKRYAQSCCCQLISPSRGRRVRSPRMLFRRRSAAVVIFHVSRSGHGRLIGQRPPLFLRAGPAVMREQIHKNNTAECVFVRACPAVISRAPPNRPLFHCVRCVCSPRRSVNSFNFITISSLSERTKLV